jgi:splicing factor 3A subunit 2
MSGFEQHVEAPDRRWQYLLFAAEPYETISFKVILFFYDNLIDYFL